MRATFLAFLALCANALILRADDAAPLGDLRPLLKELIEKNELPGAAAAIVRGDRVVALGSAGVRKFGDAAEFQPSDCVHLGSDTKAMTALLIGQLIDRKQLSIDTPMSQVFPDLAEKMNADMAKVTVRDLLDHTAGLPANLLWGLFDATGAELTKQRRRAVEQALTKAPASKIGEFSYSNTGYVILGAIIEAKTGQSWETVIEREIFKPLGMATAGFGPPGKIGTVDQPWGHVKKGDKIEPTQVDNPPVIGPAGRVHCSIADWAKFISEAMRGAQGRPKLLSAETFKALTTPRAGQGYAGGWGVTERPWAKGLTLTHAGSNTTWYCVTWIAPNRDFAVLIALNYGSGQAAQIADTGASKLIAENGRMEREK